MFFNDVAYAMGAAGEAGGDSAFGSPLSMNILLMVVIFAIFYFLIIRPQSREARRVKAMLAALKKGDRVITVGGIFGTVLEVRGESVLLDLGDSTVEIGLKFISNVVEGRPAASGNKGERRKRPAPRKASSKTAASQQAGEDQEEDEVIEAELDENHEEPADENEENNNEEKK